MITVQADITLNNSFFSLSLSLSLSPPSYISVHCSSIGGGHTDSQVHF